MGYALATQPAQLSGYIPPTITVVIPVIDALNFPPLWFASIPLWVDEVLLVVAERGTAAGNELIALPPQVRIVQHSRQSKQSALYTGLSAATGDILIVMAGDGSHNPNEITTFCALLDGGADYVKGSRFLQGGGSAQMKTPRRLRNWMLTLVARICFGGAYSDLCYGYIGFRRNALPQLGLGDAGAVNDAELVILMNLRALRYGLKVCEVPSFEK